MKTTMYDRLLQLPLFQGLCKTDFTNILEKVKLHFHKYDKGTYLTRQGETCSQLIFILNGQVVTEAENESHLYILNETLESPNVIEPYSLFGMHTYYTASYKAASDVDALLIDKRYILTQLTNYEIFNLNYLNMISNRAQTAHSKLWNGNARNIQEKIVNFILSRCNTPTGVKTLSIRMEDLAYLIDEARINVSRTLNEWQEDGLIRLNRKKIIIHDLALLVRAAEPTALK